MSAFFALLIRLLRYKPDSLTPRIRLRLGLMLLRNILFGMVVCWSTLLGGQIVKLQNGLTMRVEKADRDGDQVFLSSNSGVQILAASEVKSIEDEPDPNKRPIVAVVRPKETSTQALIRASAKTHGVSVQLVESIASVESGMRINAVSPKGAIGVMQLMPGTARQMGVDPHDVAQNIDGGTRLMRELLNRYEGDPHQLTKALAAYNAGPGAVARYQGIPPYRETRNYVKKIMNRIDAAGATGEQ